MPYSPYRITKRKLPLSIRFSLRPGYDTIQIRITVNGNEGSPFSQLQGNKTLCVTGLNWAQGQQRVVDRSPEGRQFNRLIDEVRNSLNDIYDRQTGAGVVVTPKTIKQEFQTGQLEAAKPQAGTVLDCYQRYFTYRESLQQETGSTLAETTLDKWRYGLSYLKQYVTIGQQKIDDPAALIDASVNKPAVSVNAFWAKQYHRWLMSIGPMAADAATRYVNRLIEAMSYCAESGYIDRNPIAGLKLPRDKTKDVHFLEPEHLERFWALDLPGRTGVACWWMGVIFLTGMDYPDAVRYVEDRGTYDQTKPWGKKIVITRSKPPRSECHIPVTAELESLLATKPEGKPLTSDQINDEMRAVRILIGFPHPLTCKVGRKTAGGIFFRRHKDINATSRMLGHSSVSITERYYVRTTGYQVDEVMRVEATNSVKDSQQSPFIRLTA